MQSLVNTFQQCGPRIGVSFQQIQDQLQALMNNSTSGNEFNLLELFEESSINKENVINEVAASVYLVDP
ncbi:hypothetical protein MKX03_029535 [Papaver bracteatum]|nr:hypothetical protein MKX03_029535 [Papaver bracteatum]